MSTEPAPAPGEPALPNDPTTRIDELEIRLSWMEDLLDTLNAVVARQTEQIEVLGRELMRLKDRSTPDTVNQTGTGLVTDERPPHY